MKNFLLINIKLIKYLIIFTLILSSILLFVLIFNNEINKLLFIVLIQIIILIPLIIIYIKIPLNEERTSFLKLISRINIQEKKLRGVEVGVLNGEYSEKILKFFKKKFDFNFYLVDPWNRNGFTDYSQEYLDKCYNNVKNKFEDKKEIEILRLSSELAAKKFETDSLDFVYIDGNHSYDNVLNDLEIWFPKLKSHGILFGDDYARSYGVHQAVNEFSFKHNLVVQFSDNSNQYCFIKS